MCRNNIVFKKRKGTDFLQVIRRAGRWVQLWAFLLLKDQQGIWLLGATGYWQLLETSFFRLLDGDMLEELKWIAFYFLSYFFG
jgi:hypothetical protein